MTTVHTVLTIVVLFNIVTFCVYWWDKQAARIGNWRVSEATMLQLALIGGSIGALVAQHLLRHKTRREPFRSRLFTILVIHAVLIAVALLVFTLRLVS